MPSDTPRFTPLNPDFRTWVRERLDRQILLSRMSVKITSLEPGLCVLEMPFSEEAGQHDGYFHGGLVGMLADNACAAAAATLVPLGSMPLTAEYKISLMAPAKGKKLVATGRVLRAGSTIGFCEAAVHIGDDAEDSSADVGPCAVALATIVLNPPRLKAGI